MPIAYRGSTRSVLSSLSAKTPDRSSSRMTTPGRGSERERMDVEIGSGREGGSQLIGL